MVMIDNISIMKRIAISLLAVLAICGCQVKEMDLETSESKNEPEAKVFTAVIENDTPVDTKTILGNSGKVLWKQGDQVSVFAGNQLNQRYQVTDDSDGQTEATLKFLAAPGSAGNNINNNVAYYPHSLLIDCIPVGDYGYDIRNINIPATLSYAENSFSNGAFPMAAVTSSTEDMNFTFKNLLGGLKLQLKGNVNVNTITVTGNNNEDLAGKGDVSVAFGGVPYINLNENRSKTVTLNCYGVQLNETTATVFIIPLPPVTMANGFTVTVTGTDGQSVEIKTTKPQTIERSKLLKMPEKNIITHTFVDLGLSVKWATCNVGATAPEEYGDYFAWGETAPKSVYGWETYSLCDNGNSRSLKKYNTTGSHGPVVDNKTTLDPEDDAASVNWGGSWRMPTNAEFEELFKNCSTEWTTQNGTSGLKVTSTNNNSIFFPAAGFKYDVYTQDQGGKGYYWSSSLYTVGVDMSDRNALYMYFKSGDNSTGGIEFRYEGFAVRPVKK